MVPYALKRCPGSRHLRISIDCRNRVVVTAPTGCRQARVDGFVLQNEGWIRRQLALSGPLKTLEKHLRENPSVSMGGHSYAVLLEDSLSRKGFFCLENSGGQLLFRLPVGPGRESTLRSFIRELAAQSLQERTLKLARKHGLVVDRVTIRDQTSRWGSCSSARAISLNWRLLLVPPTIQDSVILHELAHLKHLNHSRLFYQFLDSLDPNRAANEEVLNSVSSSLMRVARGE